MSGGFACWNRGSSRGLASSSLALVARPPQDDWNNLHHLSCWRDTGGTCWFRDCDGVRVSQCNKSLGYKCLCDPSRCAGSDGICHLQGNTEVAKGFSLVNAMFPDYRLYIEHSGNCGNQLVLKATSSLPENLMLDSQAGANNGKNSLFQLLQLPDPDPGNAFLLVPMANQENHCVVNPNAGFWAVKDEAPDGGPDRPAIRFQAAPGKDGAVIIESVQSPGRYLWAPGWFMCTWWNPTCERGHHVKRDTFLKGNWIPFRDFGSIQSMVGDPGDSGYWYIDPHIPGLLST